MTELLNGQAEAIDRLVERWRGRIPPRPGGGFTESDAVLITFGDMVRVPGSTRSTP